MTAPAHRLTCGDERVTKHLRASDEIALRPLTAHHWSDTAQRVQLFRITKCAVMTSKSLSDELGNGTSTELAQPLTTSQKLLRPCTSWVNGERPESFRVEKVVPTENGNSGEHKVCRFLYLHPHPRSVDGAFYTGWRAYGVYYL